VYAVGANRSGQRGVIIDEQPGTEPGGHLAKLHPDFISLARGEVFVAKLDRVHPAAQSCLDAREKAFRFALNPVRYEIQPKINLQQ
jgi:hypothetical protein